MMLGIRGSFCSYGSARRSKDTVQSSSSSDDDDDDDRHHHHHDHSNNNNSNNNNINNNNNNNNNDDDDDDGDDNNNNNRIQRRNSRIFTISSLRLEPSPKRVLKWPGSNCVQITSSAYHVQHVVLRATWYEETA